MERNQRGERGKYRRRTLIKLRWNNTSHEIASVATMSLDSEMHLIIRLLMLSDVTV
jgi:hypothetical protein